MAGTERGSSLNYESSFVSFNERSQIDALITMRPEARKKIETTRLETISFQLDLFSPGRIWLHTQMQIRPTISMSSSLEPRLSHTCRGEKLIFSAGLRMKDFQVQEQVINRRLFILSLEQSLENPHRRRFSVSRVKFICKNCFVSKFEGGELSSRGFVFLFSVFTLDASTLNCYCDTLSPRGSRSVERQASMHAPTRRLATASIQYSEA